MQGTHASFGINERLYSDCGVINLERRVRRLSAKGEVEWFGWNFYYGELKKIPSTQNCVCTTLKSTVNLKVCNTSARIRAKS